MKYILSLFFALNFLLSYGQEPAYTPMRLNYQFRGIKVDSLFLVPSFNDTTAANSSTMKNVAGAMIRTGNDFWMRNSTTSAWLQNVNTGEGASPSVEIITDISRKPNTDTIQVTKSLGLDETPVFAFRDRGFDTLRRRNDSVFAVRWGVEVFQFKDTLNPASTDSPDRINGNATGSVTADMQDEIMRFTDAEQFKVDFTQQIFLEADSVLRVGAESMIHQTQGNKYEFKDFNNTFLQIDTLGNFTAGDLTRDSLTVKLSKVTEQIELQSKKPMEWKEPLNNIKSQVKTGYADNNIDLSTGSYQILVPGIYIISNSTVNDIKLPDAANWKGQSFQIVNLDGTDATLSALGGQIFDRGTGNNLSLVRTQKLNIFYSDGDDWYGFEL